MGNLILKDDNVVWKCSNIILDVLHTYLLKEIKNKKLENNKNLTNFIEKLNQDVYGLGNIMVDISDYFKNKSELFILSLILQKAIEKASNENNWSSTIKNHCLNFYETILEIAKKK